MLYYELRKKIVEIFRMLNEKGLSYGITGNISIRIPNENLFLITPSGLKKATLKIDDILIINENGEIVEGKRNPSIETLIHLAIYKKRNDVNAIIHAHPIYSSVFAVIGIGIAPIVEEMILYTGGEIKVAKYAPSGTEELANNVIEALNNRKAVLLMNHGIITCGKDLDDAFDVLICVERVAKIYLLSKIIGEPKILPKEIIEIEEDLFKLKQD
jgi:L-fuculose-phosphate aldolase